MKHEKTRQNNKPSDSEQELDEPLEKDIHTKMLDFHRTLNRHARQQHLLEDRVEILEPFVKQIAALEDRIKELEKKETPEPERTSKADLIYEKNKEMLEKEHMDEVVAFDIETEEVAGFGATVREAFDNAKKKSGKEQFYLKRVGSKFMHRL